MRVRQSSATSHRIAHRCSDLSNTCPCPGLPTPTSLRPPTHEAEQATSEVALLAPVPLSHPPAQQAKQVTPPVKWRCSPSDEGLHGAIRRRLQEAHLHRRGVFESVRAVGAELAAKQST